MGREPELPAARLGDELGLITRSDGYDNERAPFRDCPVIVATDNVEMLNIESGLVMDRGQLVDIGIVNDELDSGLKCKRVYCDVIPETKRLKARLDVVEDDSGFRRSKRIKIVCVNCV
jgi:hypothetical protein